MNCLTILRGAPGYFPPPAVCCVAAKEGYHARLYEGPAPAVLSGARAYGGGTGDGPGGAGALLLVKKDTSRLAGITAGFAL